MTTTPHAIQRTRRAHPAQRGFHFPHKPIASALRPGEIVVDLFAGGGGASEALEQALGRPVDIAINHDEWAIAMHAANHPYTQHLQADVWQADPVRLVAGRPVGWFHGSPDCTHFSQAKGGQPRSRKTRALSWCIVKWAGKLARVGSAPRIISLENVEQILKWGPLIAKRCRKTGRVITLEMIKDPQTGKLVHRVAEPGERVPVRNQALVPDPRHQGRTWGQFVGTLQALGYVVQWGKLVSSDFGGGTSRKRLFLLARRDGEPIGWPKPTHGEHPLLPIVRAADSIDWSIPCKSIFGRKKPLADATMRRIARGIKRYVIDAAEPFIVPVTHSGSDRVQAASDPLRTITTANRGEFMVCAPTLIQAAHGEGQGSTARRGSGAHSVQDPVGTIHAGGGSFALAAAHLVKFRGDSLGSDAKEPMPTITSGAGAKRPAGAAHALGVITAFLEQANGGGPNGNPAPPRAASEPLSSITGTGSQQRVVTANLITLRKNLDGADVTEPVRTITAGAEHHAVVECTLSPEQEAGAQQVAAFLMRYYGQGGQWGGLANPMDTITTKDRFALVTVTIQGTPYVIVDIGLRMLTRKELFRAQGFPPDYIIDRTADGRELSISKSVRMVGNSVSPPPLIALARANLDPATMAVAA